jgi:hypothetical protein
MPSVSMIKGVETYLLATLIIWITTPIAIVVGQRKLREQRSGSISGQRDVVTD